MADNVDITPGSGATVATDEVAVNGGTPGHVQFVKLVDGAADGTDGIPGGTGGLKVALGLVGGLSNARTTALAQTLLVKASAGTLFGLQGYTDDDGYVQVIADADATLSGGEQALEVIRIASTTGGPFSLDFGPYGVAIATGITIAFSTTGPTYTAGGSHMFVSAQYI